MTFPDVPFQSSEPPVISLAESASNEQTPAYDQQDPQSIDPSIFRTADFQNYSDENLYPDGPLMDQKRTASALMKRRQEEDPYQRFQVG